MSNELSYLLSLKAVELDELLALVVEKYTLLQKLPLKRLKQLNVMYGENYMRDYENALYNLKKKLEELRYE